jgi:hypothetical protein
MPDGVTAAMVEHLIDTMVPAVVKGQGGEPDRQIGTALVTGVRRVDGTTSLVIDVDCSMTEFDVSALFTGPAIPSIAAVACKRPMASLELP